MLGKSNFKVLTAMVSNYQRHRCVVKDEITIIESITKKPEDFIRMKLDLSFKLLVLNMSYIKYTSQKKKHKI